VVQGNNLINFSVFLFEVSVTELQFINGCIVFSTLYFPNLIGTFCTHASSICPTAKDGKKTDWKYYNRSESEYQDHSKRDRSSNVLQLQGTIMIQKNFHFCFYLLTLILLM